MLLVITERKRETEESVRVRICDLNQAIASNHIVFELTYDII